ncbi:hypothetical protein [Dyadobacter diqingensis]|uniref:hypothetical protein n=1 Tax=Dyadobacter diqingensis TaxID=2938121 RepID=UPI0020C1A516|nr:hypothetical protein [Dyadobacter diqingensis]
MQNFYSYLPSILLCLFLSCCTSKRISPAEPEPDVYVTGTEWGNSISRIMYWKNGQSFILPSPSHEFANIRATGIAVSGGDVHVIGGGYLNTRIGSFGTYWKNGVISSVSPTKIPTSFDDITVAGNDVYIAGSVYDPFNIHLPSYWKNGVPIIGNGNALGTMTGISISGSEVYTCGFTQNQIGPVAKYWRNGIEVNLSNSKNVTNAVAIAASGNDVHVVGFEFDRVTSRFTPKYWKNGIENNLDDSGNSALARDIAVAGKDVYIVGIEYVNQVRKAVIWKNGVKNYLIGSDATSVATLNNNVYVTTVTTPCLNCNPTYLKNNTPILLSGTEISADPYSIFVTNP